MAELKPKLFETLLGVTPSGRKPAPHCGWDAELVEAFSGVARDLDTEFVSWLWHGCPGGVAKCVRPGEIFPTVDNSEVIGSDLSEQLTNAESLRNYVSVEEAPSLAGSEIDRLVQRGFAVHCDTYVGMPLLSTGTGR